jgi:spore coat polysaccharide biosynthesis protein SpsF (cytidylyltransferase family)
MISENKNKTPINVAAIIQARMNSTRLAGKVLMEVMGRPLLSYQIERLRFCKAIDDMIIATTENPQDDPIVHFAKEEGLKWYRGSENDVLDRYYRTAVKYHVRHIVRITADCPLIQPDVCDRTVKACLDSGADYVRTGSTFAEGLDCEVMRFESLHDAWRNARLDSEREHVTLYIRNRPDVFQSLEIENHIDDGIYRITVDEASDFDLVKAVIESLYEGKDRYFTIQDVKAFLNSHRHIFALNAHIIRNEGLMKSVQKEEAV